MGGNLASVHSSEDYYDIQSLIRRVTHELKETWIGGSDAAEVSITQYYSIHQNLLNTDSRSLSHDASCRKVIGLGAMGH